MNIEEIITEIDFLSSEIGYIGIDSIKDAHSAQQALDILKNRIKRTFPIHSGSNPVCPKCKSTNNTGLTYDDKYCCCGAYRNCT